MPTNRDLDAGLLSANTTFMARRDEIMSRAQLAGPFNKWTDSISNTGRWENHFIANWAVMRPWTGAKREKVLRDYSEVLLPISYEATTPIKRLTLSRDKTGAVGKALSGLLNQGATAHDESTADAMDGNSGAGPTGYDGVSLVNATHPHVNSGSGHSNIGSGTLLTHANFSTGRAAMRSFKFENGEPMRVAPDNARCGQSQEQKYKEILEATTRLQATDMQGNESAVAVQDTSQIDNVWKGELDLTIDERISTFFWDILALNIPNNKPMTLIDERRPEAVMQTDMTDPRRFNFDQFVYSLEGEWKVGAGMWATIYRGTPTS